jgi:hypothetical protein
MNATRPSILSLISDLAPFSGRACGDRSKPKPGPAGSSGIDGGDFAYPPVRVVSNIARDVSSAPSDDHYGATPPPTAATPTLGGDLYRMPERVTTTIPTPHSS